MMKWTGKVVGGLLGMLALGPIGAALGIVVGHQFDRGDDEGESPKVGRRDGARTRTIAIGEQFFRATFRVMGHVAKADGRVSEREIEAARAVMSELRLTPEQIQAAIACFTEGKQPSFDLQSELVRLREACADRPDLLRIFMEIQVRAALAGNNVEGPVRVVLGRVAARLGISMLELAQIEAVLRIRRGSFTREAPRDGAQEQLAQAYRVLECEPTASNEEVARAYRRQLSRHHPDKLKANGLPESMIEHAKQRTQQIIEAWDLIKARRGLS